LRASVQSARDEAFFHVFEVERVALERGWIRSSLSLRFFAPIVTFCGQRLAARVRVQLRRAMIVHSQKFDGSRLFRRVAVRSYNQGNCRKKAQKAQKKSA
jgi:hypothetical protein